MPRILIALFAMLLASCGMDESASSRSETRSWAPRISYAGGANVPKVDYVRLVVTLHDGKGTTLPQQVDWSQGKVVVNGIPGGVPFTAQVKGMLQDGSEVWSGSTEVGGDQPGEIAVTSQVTVSSAVGIDLALDETALTSPVSGSFPRVLVKNWPYANTDIHVLYTTDESVPTYGSSSTREYAGPFTLQGSGKLRIRAYRTGAASTTAASSAILAYGYAGTNPTACNVPSFQPLPGVVNSTGIVNVMLNGPSTCELRYRTDGIDPGASDPLWVSSQVALANGITNLRLRAIGPAAGASIMSPVMEGSWMCPNCTQAVAPSIAAVGNTNVPMNLGSTTGLSVSVTGADPSQVVWSIEGGATYANFLATASGTSIQLQTVSTLPAGVSNPTVKVKAAIAGTAKYVLYTIAVSGSGSAPVSLVASGNTTIPVTAGTSVQLSTVLTGALPSDVAWSIESGNVYASFSSVTTGTAVQVMISSSWPSTLATPVVVKAEIPGTANVVRFTLNVTAVESSIHPSGTGAVNLSAGSTNWLYATVNGAPSTDVVWSIESGASDITLSGSGTSAQVSVNSSFANGTSLANAVVVATLTGTAKTARFSLSLSGGMPASFSAMNTTNQSIDAGGVLQLNTQVGGLTSPSISWSVMSGPGTVVGNGLSANYYAPSGTAASQMAVVRATLANAGKYVDFSVTINPVVVEVQQIEVSGAGTFELAPGERAQLMVATTPTNAAVQWALQGTSLGAVEPYGFYSYYQAPSLTQLPATGTAQMTVRATLASDANKYVDFVVNVHAKPLEFRDNDGKADTVYSVPATTASFYLAAWKNGYQATAAQWTLVESPAGAANPAFTQTDGAIRFQGTGTGRYRFKVTDGGYVSTVAIDWGTP